MATSDRTRAIEEVRRRTDAWAKAWAATAGTHDGDDRTTDIRFLLLVIDEARFSLSAAQARERALREALGSALATLDAARAEWLTAHVMHWDRQGTGGLNCPACNLDHNMRTSLDEARTRLRAALSPAAPAEEKCSTCGLPRSDCMQHGRGGCNDPHARLDADRAENSETKR